MFLTQADLLHKIIGVFFIKRQYCTISRLTSLAQTYYQHNLNLGTAPLDRSAMPGPVSFLRFDTLVGNLTCLLCGTALQSITSNHFAIMAASRTKRTKIIAARRTASTASQTISRLPTCTAGVENVVMETNKKVRKVMQTIHITTDKISLT